MARMAALLEVRGAGVSDEELTALVSMGDDAVERSLDGETIQYYEKLGHRVKDVSLANSVEEVEFCSHHWLPNGLAFPVTVWKTLFRFFSHPPDSTNYLDWYAQLRNDLRNYPESDSIFEVARAHAEWAKSNGTQEEQQPRSSPSAEGACQQY